MSAAQYATVAMPPTPSTAADEAALFQQQTHGRYELFTILSVSFLSFTILCGSLIRILIYRMAAPGYSPEPMRINASCQVINALKMANLAILSTIAGCLGVTAKGVSGILTAQNAANLVNVISVTYGANDLLPHGRADIINGAIGSLAAQSAIGLYAEGVNWATRTASYVNLGTNVLLILILTFLDIDKFVRRAETPFIHRIVSIEEIPYKYLRYCYQLSTCACLGRVSVLLISFLYSVMSLVLFYCNRGKYERADEHAIALAPLAIMISSLGFHILCDMWPTTHVALRSEARFHHNAQRVRCQAAVDAIIEADEVEDAWEKAFGCNNFRLYRDYCREDGEYTPDRRKWLNATAVAGYQRFLRQLIASAEAAQPETASASCMGAGAGGATEPARGTTSRGCRDELPDVEDVEAGNTVKAADQALQTASLDLAAALHATKTARYDELLAEAAVPAAEAALASAKRAALRFRVSTEHVHNILTNRSVVKPAM